jgi:hypothetical protein
MIHFPPRILLFENYLGSTTENFKQESTLAGFIDHLLLIWLEITIEAPAGRNQESNSVNGTNLSNSLPN